MKIKQKIVMLLIASVIGVFSMAPIALAVDKDPCEGVVLKGDQKCINGVATSVVDVKCGTGSGVEGSCIWSLLLMAINILTAGIGLVAVGGVVYGSILYTSAGGSTENTKKAIQVIQNVVIGLIAYAVMYAFLNYIIPGGMFS
jgi:hypothetical protein